MKSLMIGFLCALLLVSCQYEKDFAKVNRGGSNEEKYEFAYKAYDKQDYKRAVLLFEDLLPVYRGRDGLEDILYHLAYAYFYMEDYYMASYYFKSISRQFANSPRVEEVFYMAAYCKVLESPFFKLDQSATKEAIKQLQLFINYYPYSERVPKANELIVEMREKLALKAYTIAEMYYKRELFNASAIAFKNFANEYPESNKREDALFYMVKSQYLYAKNSVARKQRERYAAVLDGYEVFYRSFSESKYEKELEKYYKESKSKIE